VWEFGDWGDGMLRTGERKDTHYLLEDICFRIDHRSNKTVLWDMACVRV
jgi:hypothetical protein